MALAFCLALGGFVLSGCSGSSDPFVQKEYTADILQIEKINVDVRDRKIEVSILEDAQIHIICFESSKEAYDITVSDERVLAMTSAGHKEWTDYVGTKPSAENRKISLQIPDALLNTLTLSTTNEDISLPALAVTGSISLSSNGGSIAFGSLKIGNALTLSVKNGDISGRIAESCDEFAIQTKIKKGESNLPASKNGREKILNVSSNNGDVRIEFANESLCF